MGVNERLSRVSLTIRSVADSKQGTTEKHGHEIPPHEQEQRK